VSESESATPEHVLCDTSFISVVQEALRRPDATAHWPEERRSRLDSAILAMSVVSLAELRSGHIYACWGQERRDRAEALMGAYVWAPLDMEIVDVCAALRAEKRKRGWGLGDNDSWIAATAMSRRWPLAACDLHFCDVEGLDLIYLPATPESRADCPE
jgi:predicted nucleic acid-binding protein